MMKQQEIVVIYGDQPRRMMRELLEQLQLEREIPQGARIGIKPNLVAARPAASGATTTPELVDELVGYLQEKGYKKIVILEGSWVGDSTARAFKLCGYEELARRRGVELFDTKKDQSRPYRGGGMEIRVCNRAMELDYLINMPVLKGHCQTAVTCALKNMKGVIPDSEKRRFHTLGLHRPIACLNKIRHADLILVDGLNGDLDFEEGGNPVPMHRLLAGVDPVLVDAYVANLMGYEVDEIEYIRLAEQLGVGSADLNRAEIRELNHDSSHPDITSSRKVSRLAAHIDQRDACSACYGNLIHALARLEESGELGRLKGKIAIGQGFRGVDRTGIGIGACTAGCQRHLGGCPARAVEIVRFLREEL